jgi:transposase-like protein
VGKFLAKSVLSDKLLEQEEFRQHLRCLAVSAVQVLIEQVMREELEQCIGASWGECTPHRRGYRNGHYTRDLVTSTGRIRNLNQSLTHQFEIWRQRPLQPYWRVLHLDGIHFTIRHGDKADATIILTALAVDLEGNW